MIRIKKYQIIYTLISPNGKCNETNAITIYAATENIARTRLFQEFQRRFGHLYRWEININSIEDEQLALFETD
ncbi:hypothetical protein [Bacillus wiedmannii]|uniref:hypothetical protein n=1 Tax=Bacillus wiedmannii TaxID=1890302 RepID=UPI0010BDDC4A|nr:hypothetical protein [Bacillus wiedmannii]